MEDILRLYVEILFQDLTVAALIVIQNAFWLFTGIIIGMIIGVIPGMGSLVSLTLLVPFTFGLEPNQAFTLLSGALGATTFTGSITAILINTPGTSANVATLIDGYPLSQRGEGATAIVASAISSASGAAVAVMIFIFSVPLIIQFALIFSSSEIFWLLLFSIIIIPILLSTEKPIFGIMTAGFGGLLAFVGTAPQTGEPRLIFGQPFLYGGIGLVSMLIGLFAISEIIRLISIQKEQIVNRESLQISGSKLKGLNEFLKHKSLWFRCSLIGTIVGAIPGAGAVVASLLAYAHAAQSGKEDDEIKFGEGRIEGVIAPEAANDAKDAGQMFPTLGLGIPGSGAMAVFLAALLLHGFFPGPQFIVENRHLVLVIILSLFVSNISTSSIGIMTASYLVRILTIPLPRIYVLIIVTSLTSVYIIRNQYFDVMLALAFALFGLLLIYLEISRVPFLVAFVLAGPLERNFTLALRYANFDVFDAFFVGYLNLSLILIFLISVAIAANKIYGIGPDLS